MHAVGSFEGKFGCQLVTARSALLSFMCSALGLVCIREQCTRQKKNRKLFLRLILHSSSNQLNSMQKTDCYPKKVLFRKIRICKSPQYFIMWFGGGVFPLI